MTSAYQVQSMSHRSKNTFFTLETHPNNVRKLKQKDQNKTADIDYTGTYEICCANNLYCATYYKIMNNIN